MTAVREYYEANTGKFLLFGAEGAIHRELWAERVTSREQAVHHVHELMLAELRASAESLVGGDALQTCHRLGLLTVGPIREVKRRAFNIRTALRRTLSVDVGHRTATS
jgi:hypothetical protein